MSDPEAHCFNCGVDLNSKDVRVRWCKEILPLKLMILKRQFASKERLTSYEMADVETDCYDANPDKNRYEDVYCIDETRVVLKERPAGKDYIHANWITTAQGQKYICTQAPMVATVEDFWHMMVTERSNVIVMLTPLASEKFSLCHKYYPTSGVMQFGAYRVALKGTKPDPFPGVKHLVFHVEGPNDFCMSVHHFSVAGWESHVAPPSPTPIVGLLKLAKKLALNSPITVHCSSGTGASATFIAIDYVSQKIKEEGEFVHMPSLIEELRFLRYQSISSCVEYAFLHLCLLELFIQEGVICRGKVYKKRLASFNKWLKSIKEKASREEAEGSTPPKQNNNPAFLNGEIGDPNGML